MQQTVHAEQSAVTHARLRGESGLATMTVNYTPCGHCRQFMNELNSGTALRISLPDRPVVTLADYLPDAFGPRDLNITTLVMDKVDHGYRAGATRWRRRRSPPPTAAMPLQPGAQRRRAANRQRRLLSRRLYRKRRLQPQPAAVAGGADPVEYARRKLP